MIFYELLSNRIIVCDDDATRHMVGKCEQSVRCDVVCDIIYSYTVPQYVYLYGTVVGKR